MELSPPNQVILELFHNVISDGGGGGYWTVVQEVAMSDRAGSFYCVLCKVYQYSAVWSQLTTHFNRYSPHLNTFHNINILS